MMLKAVFLAAVASADAMALTCAKTGEECTGGIECCNSAMDPPDHCEEVNQFFMKCVTQPTCAMADQQCKGKGDSVMEPTPCCDDGYVCVDVNEYYSKCADTNAPGSPPPSPYSPPATCADTGGQCGGGGFSPLDCCEDASECEVVNEYYSKCVDQPKCAGDNALCKGTGNHVMKDTPCCSDDHTCSEWGTGWFICRAAGEETCAVHGEQCFGTGGSEMPEKDCCDPAESCVSVNEYYSKCDAPPKAGLTVAASPEDSCPGLEHGCPKSK